MAILRTKEPKFKSHERMRHQQREQRERAAVLPRGACAFCGATEGTVMFWVGGAGYVPACVDGCEVAA